MSPRPWGPAGRGIEMAEQGWAGPGGWAALGSLEQKEEVMMDAKTTGGHRNGRTQGRTDGGVARGTRGAPDRGGELECAP
jgi:hypothetical protein